LSVAISNFTVPAALSKIATIKKAQIAATGRPMVRGNGQ
jgi:hypothetical protein